MSEERGSPVAENKSAAEPFDDDIGREVLEAVERAENVLSELANHLENQFGDVDEEQGQEDSNGNAKEEQQAENKIEGEQLQDLIDMLNREESDSDQGDNSVINSMKVESDTMSARSGGVYGAQPHGNRRGVDDLESVATDETNTKSQHDNFSQKLINLIQTLHSRDEMTGEEWETDDDPGYVTITLSEAEFFDFEDRSTVRMFMVRNSVREQPRQEPSSVKSSPIMVSKPFSAASVPDTVDDIVSDDTPLHKMLEPAGETDEAPLKDVATEEIKSLPQYTMKKDYIPLHKDPFALMPPPPPPLPEFNTEMGTASKRQSINERRRSEIMGQHRFQGADGTHCFFNLKIIFEPYKTGFEETKDLVHSKGMIIAGRYEVQDVLGQAAFSTALQCQDLAAEEDEAQFVCLKVIKNNKDFFDQSLDEIKLLQYINSRGDPDEHHVLRLIDYFYCKEHLFIVSELLKENLYEFGRFIRDNGMEIYYTLPRLKRIAKQVLEALAFIHSLRLIHCDVKPENIVIRSFSRCEVKLIDFGSSCFITDHLTTYIQSRSYRAPEVIIGHPYDSRIDIWSVGAVIAELYTGYVLFQNDSVQTMLSRITGILGAFPEQVLQEGRDTSKYFTLSNIVYERDDTGMYHLVFPKRTSLKTRLHLGDSSMTRDEELFVDFIRVCLHLDPKTRVSAYEALQHPWLADADTNEIEQYIIGQPAGGGIDGDGNGGNYHVGNGMMVPMPPFDDEDGDEDDEEGADDDFMDDDNDDDYDDQDEEEGDDEEEAREMNRMTYTDSAAYYGDRDLEDEAELLDDEQRIRRELEMYDAAELEEIAARLAAYEARLSDDDVASGNEEANGNTDEGIASTLGDEDQREGETEQTPTASEAGNNQADGEPSTQ